MNGTQPHAEAAGNSSRETSMSEQFAGLVLQQTNLALMLLGKSPHPDTQRMMLDIDGAKMFIDQLEMLEVKTRGNLKADEAKLLKQSLTALRLAFVDAVQGHPQFASAEPPKQSAAPVQTPDPSLPPDQASTPPSEDEARKKFSKRY